MNPVQTIVQRYQNGGEEQRLNLFLTHRDLRDVFMTIEQQAAGSRGTEQAKLRHGWWNQLRGALLSWCGAI